jgi:hypothetical protein
MKPDKKPAELCAEIADEVREVASWLASGRLNPEQFRAAVVTLEAAKVKRFGFALDSREDEGGRTAFSLRFADTREVCSTLVFDPATTELTVQQVCS